MTTQKLTDLYYVLQKLVKDGGVAVTPQIHAENLARVQTAVRNIFLNVVDQYAVATGTDTYAAAFPATLTADNLVAGLTVKVQIPNANTGAATLNVDGLGAKPIKKNGTSALAANDLLANAIYTFTFDGTNWQK